MKRITGFDRANLRELAKYVEGVLKQDKHLQELGVAITMGGGRFDLHNAQFKLEVSLMKADGTAQTRYEVDFKRYAETFGLKPEDFGKSFRIHNQVHKIVGLNIKGHAKPIMTEADGHQYKWAASSLLVHLKTAEVV